VISVMLPEITGLDGQIALSDCPSMSHLFVDTSFEFGVVENFVYRTGSTVIITSDLFVRIESVTMTMCSR